MPDPSKIHRCGCGGVSTLDFKEGDGTNTNCHTYTGGVTLGGGRRLRVPRIVLVLWDHFFITNPKAVTFANQLIMDLISGRFMNGLVQYGISRGSLLSTITLDTSTFPAPGNWDAKQTSDRDQIKTFLDNGNIAPKPAVNEGSLLYFFFLPTTTTLTNGTNSDGSPNTNVCGWHGNTKYNDSSNGNDLFWCLIRTDGASTKTEQGFVDAVAFCAGHELSEAFTNPDGGGYIASNGCEIGDICESKTGFTYRGWNNVEQYWSNWDSACLQGDNPVRMRQYLAARNLDPASGLRALGTSVITADWLASTL
jgi:hypothetical protein